MRFEWDTAKAASNVRKHQVSFALAVYVFDDPHHISQPDPHEDGDRWQTIGMAGFATLFVVHTLIEPELHHGRLISARKATAVERQAYARGDFP